MAGPGLPREQVKALRAALPGAKALAWGEGPDGYVVALPSHLALGRDAAWDLVAWHDVVHGGWDADAERLTWRDAAGEARSVELTRAGELPVVFRERVDATFVAAEQVGPPEAAAAVTVQRRLDAPGAALVCRVAPVDPARPPSASTREAAERRLAELRRDLM